VVGLVVVVLVAGEVGLGVEGVGAVGVGVVVVVVFSSIFLSHPMSTEGYCSATSIVCNCREKLDKDFLYELPR